VADADDAIYRTRLANERTLLAWWRTGFTLLALGIGVGRLLPELTSGARWPYEAIGIAFAIVGIVFIWIGHRRSREIEQALDRGEFVPFSAHLSLALTVAGTVLAIAAIGVVLVSR
jgi:uncharacterized membrane protein YidH (DUF202 family)